ncbi:hypothetical protein ACWDKQ_30620 [Saccharopolyspora sp. NPDC000995]
MDCNAFRGSRDELAALLGGGSPTLAAQEVDLLPDERAALFSIQNELVGPRGPQGQIQGWPTALGPRTIVAMLMEMFNTWQPARRPPGVDHDVWPIDLLADGNVAAPRNEGKLGSIEQRLAALYATASKLAELLATDRDLDPERITLCARWPARNVTAVERVTRPRPRGTGRATSPRRAGRRCAGTRRAPR